VRQNTTECDRGADQGIQFFVAANCELQVAGRDALDLEILRGILRSDIMLAILRSTSRMKV
jgi:hypothetical protein